MYTITMHRLLRLSRGLTNQIVNSTSLVCVRNASDKGFIMGRQGRTMNKFLTGKVKSKKNWKMDDVVPKLPSIASLSNPTSQGKSSLRRVQVLNKLFMGHITDYMATDVTFAGYGLEISRVNITTDFKLVNVYWFARGDESDEKLETILTKSAGKVRYNLSALRLMGEVPMIQFVKDKFYAKSVEVNALLKVADFGDDYVPSTMSQLIKNDLSSSNPIQFDNELPEMTHTILGLNHAKIMNQIKQNMSKTKQAWEKYETELSPSLLEKYARTGEERKDAIVRLRDEEFQAFLSQRRSRNRKERRPRPITDNDDLDDDDADLFEDEDTYTDDFEIEKK